MTTEVEIVSTETNTVEDGPQHAPLAPSSLEATELCSDYAFKDADPADTSQGTLVHNALEARDPSILGEDDEAWMMYARGAAVIDRRRSTFDTVEHEVRLHTHRADCWGTADLLSLNANRSSAVLDDWKCGRVPVSNAKNNAQGVAYALGVFTQYPTVQQVTVNFHMLRTGETSSAVFTRGEMKAMEMRIDRIAALRAEGGRRNATYNCRNCALFLDCEVTRKAVLPEAAKSSVELGRLANPDNIQSADDAAKALEAKEVLTKWVENWGDRVTERALQISTICDIPGYEPATKRGRGKVANVEELDEELARAGFASFLNHPDAITVSVSKLTDAIIKTTLMKELGSTRTKAASDRRKELKAQLEGLWENGTFYREPSSRYMKKVIKETKQIA